MVHFDALILFRLILVILHEHALIIFISERLFPLQVFCWFFIILELFLFWNRIPVLSRMIVWLFCAQVVLLTLHFWSQPKLLDKWNFFEGGGGICLASKLWIFLEIYCFILEPINIGWVLNGISICHCRCLYFVLTLKCMEVSIEILIIFLLQQQIWRGLTILFERIGVIIDKSVYHWVYLILHFLGWVVLFAHFSLRFNGGWVGRLTLLKFVNLIRTLVNIWRIFAWDLLNIKLSAAPFE